MNSYECNYSHWEDESSFILHRDGDVHRIVMQGRSQLFTVTVGEVKKRQTHDHVGKTTAAKFRRLYLVDAQTYFQGKQKKKIQSGFKISHLVAVTLIWMTSLKCSRLAWNLTLKFSCEI